MEKAVEFELEGHVIIKKTVEFLARVADCHGECSRVSG
jgi:hypothetical protein